MRSVIPLGFVLVAGCIVFVPARDGGDHCAFAGMVSDCGTCVRDRCQDAVDACCLDAACAPVLSELEGCATVRDARCTSLRARGDGNALARCVRDKCSGACAAVIGTSKTACREPPLGPETGCTCDAKDPGATNRFVCGTDTYPSTVCCAPLKWPAPGASCSCRALGCNATTEGCTCELVDFIKPESPVCEGVKCCAVKDSCTCRSDRPCYPNEHEVSRCSSAEVGCPDGTVQVAACSVFE